MKYLYAVLLITSGCDPNGSVNGTAGSKLRILIRKISNARGTGSWRTWELFGLSNAVKETE